MNRSELLSFHAFLRGACPISGGELMAECQVMHKAGIGAGLPLDALELSKAVRSLEAEGLLRKADGLLYWRAERAKAEQASLFA